MTAPDDPRHDPATWQRAAEAWLQTKSPNTRRTYRIAIDQFTQFSHKEPWQIAGRDVIAWQTHLRAQGRSESTINFKLAALSSYYNYCAQQYTIIHPAAGRELPIATSNPAARPQRAKTTPYHKTTHLDAREVKALLRAIDRTTITGLRDFALILAYLYTGRRSNEIRLLKWGDISIRNDRVYYRWSGKGKTGRQDELPWPVYHAITDYLNESDRWEPNAGDYVFIATNDMASRLPCVKRTRNGNGPPRPGSRPLSPGMINRIVKKAARRAGLRADLIHTHTLRHTAAMLRRQLTDDLQEIQQFLNHASLNTTQIYLQHTEQRNDNLWTKVQALIGIDP